MTRILSVTFSMWIKWWGIYLYVSISSSPLLGPQVLLGFGQGCQTSTLRKNLRHFGGLKCGVGSHWCECSCLFKRLCNGFIVQEQCIWRLYAHKMLNLEVNLYIKCCMLNPAGTLKKKKQKTAFHPSKHVCLFVCSRNQWATLRSGKNTALGH